MKLCKRRSRDSCEEWFLSWKPLGGRRKIYGRKWSFYVLHVSRAMPISVWRTKVPDGPPVSLGVSKAQQQPQQLLPLVTSSRAYDWGIGLICRCFNQCGIGLTSRLACLRYFGLICRRSNKCGIGLTSRLS